MTPGDVISGPVFVAGPPGAGKSTLSRAAAELLDVAWLDTDLEIERRLGLSPADLIRRRGELALRAEERSMVGDLDDAPRLVALGGGAWIDADVRALVRGRGPVVGLTAEPDQLWRRIEAAGATRPLCPDRLAFDALMTDRQPFYERVDRVVTADDPEAGARTLARAAQDLGFVKLTLDGATTRILAGRDLSRATAGAVAEHAPSRPVLVIEDAGAPAELRDAYALALRHQVSRVVRQELPGGEAVKTWASLGAALESALREGCGRQSVIVGIGGGAVCDLAAMVAGLLGRGAPLVLVPTTLLAQVDAAIGGKAAVNLGGNKNQVGLFAPASDVLVDLDFLASLDATRLSEGLAETYKAALLSSELDRAQLMADCAATLRTVLRAIQTKCRIVEADPRERGARRLLNLGHTWGHAVEAASAHDVPHGHAVAIGLAFIARWSAQHGGLDPSTRDLVIEDLQQLGLPTRTPPELVEPALARLRSDKKGDAERVALIALRAVGRAEIVEHSWKELEAELLRLEE